MERLLNQLIKKGWKPFNVDCDWTNVEVINRLNDNRYIPEHSEIIFQTDTHRHVFDCNIRDLVSKSSGLWQFVCENNLVEYDTESGWGEFSFRTDYINGFYGKHIFESNYQYRIIESALRDESELEDFLLSNIKVDVESN